MSGAPRSLTVFTHTRPADTEGALRRVAELARRPGVEVRLPAAELEKFGLDPGRLRGARPGDRHGPRARARGRRHDPDGAAASSPGTGVPVFAINFGAIGFLATIEPWELEEGLAPGAARRVRPDGACPA